MRIATITFQTNATSQMNNLQADLAKTQNDLATGTRLHSAADDPAAMSQVNTLNVQMSASTQYVTNGNYATSTLQLEEQAMSDATNTLQSARDLAVEANNPALSASQRADIAAQLQQQLQDLISIGNRVDGSGNQIFAGTASNTVPFSQNGTTVNYLGATQTSLRFLPEHATDFVFASLAEQRGFFGAGVLLMLYLLVVWRGLKAVAGARDPYSAIVAGGIIFAFLFQIFVNVGMTIGIAPVTGIPLPMVSVGGSSMIANLLAIGVLQAIYVRGRGRTRIARW